jgi:hypothetical protein
MGRMSWDAKEARKRLIERLTKSWTSDNGTEHCCRKRVARGNVLWMVWESTPIGLDPCRSIEYAVLIRAEGDGWTYKRYGGEDEGPNYETCPLSFFKDVPEPPNQYAKEWRAKLIEQANKRKGYVVDGWVRLIYRKPAFVKCRQVWPLKFYGYKTPCRSRIDRPVPELDTLVAKLYATFGAGWLEYGEPSIPLRLQLIGFAKANPWPLSQEDLINLKNHHILDFSQVLVLAWCGKIAEAYGPDEMYMAKPWEGMKEAA